MKRKLASLLLMGALILTSMPQTVVLAEEIPATTEASGTMQEAPVETAAETPAAVEAQDNAAAAVTQTLPTTPANVTEETLPTTPMQVTEATLPTTRANVTEETLPTSAANVTEATLPTTTEGAEEPADTTRPVVNTYVMKTEPAGDTAAEEAVTDQPAAGEAIGVSSIPDDEELDIRNKDVLAMVMPVIREGTYDFTMDPMHLISQFGFDKEKYQDSTIYFRNTNGEEVYYSGMSDIAVAKNKSSVPVLLHVSITMENPNGWPVHYSALENVEADEELNLAFALIPTSFAGEQPSVHTDHAISIDESGKAEMTILLPGSMDNFNDLGESLAPKEDAVWAAAGFAVTSACNGNADWESVFERSKLNEELRVHVNYNMAPLTETQTAMLAAGMVIPDPVTGMVSFPEEPLPEPEIPVTEAIPEEPME